MVTVVTISKALLLKAPEAIGHLGFILTLCVGDEGNHETDVLDLDGDVGASVDWLAYIGAL